VSLLIGLIYFVRYLLGYVTVSGYASLIISLWFIGGMVILLLGVIGLYLGKAFDKIKNRPIFIIESTLNC